jgi:hypothetical protein
MSEKSKKNVRKFRRSEGTAERRWKDRDQTIQRRQARFVKSISRNA